MPKFTKHSKIPRKSILGEYKIKIWQDKDGEEYNDWYLATITCPDGYEGMTQGENEEEILLMVADWILTVYDIPAGGLIGKIKRFINKIRFGL